MIYRISNWEELFETSETRKLESLRWVPVPNKHDGLGFRTVAAQRNSAELYAAWHLMLQLASKAKRGARGILARDGRGLTADDMAIMTGFPKEGFARALTFFSEKLNWIALEGSPELPAGSAVGLTSSVPAAQSAGTPADDPAPPADDAGRPGRREGKGMEVKVGSGEGSPPAAEALIAAMSENPAYRGIDVRREFAKMQAWCEVNRKPPSRKRFVNWLNRADAPLFTPPPQGNSTADPLWTAFIATLAPEHRQKHRDPQFAPSFLKDDFAAWKRTQ